MSSNFFECIKTGCYAKIAERYAYGDLYRLGSGYILKAVQWNWMPLPGHTKLNVEFDTWHGWWGNEGEGDSFDYILLNEPEWFKYDGKPLGN